MRSTSASGGDLTQWRGAGETGRTGQIAVLVDLDQRQAAVLLVIGAEPAIVGTALVDAGVKLERHIARLQKSRQRFQYAASVDIRFSARRADGSALGNRTQPCSCRILAGTNSRQVSHSEVVWPRKM